MGRDSRIEREELKGNVHQSQINEANQRGFCQRWADLMSAETRADVPVR